MPLRLPQLNARHAVRAAKACLLALGLACAGVQAAENYPARPIRFVVPFAPGGVTDLTARTFAKYMGDALGKPLVTRTSPARARPSAPTLSRARRRTAIRCCSVPTSPMRSTRGCSRRRPMIH
ncbi:hypothetical protein [Cupriavidus sp. DF5525]|uniref:hypothetical protein n=1 Tax=Cupriavidus sp. DF5525 TaxID=3160989 RepID=UPI0032E03941